MHLLEVIGDLAGANQGEDVDLARLQQHRDNLRAFAVDGVDDALRERAAKRLQQGREQQHAELRRLEPYHGSVWWRVGWACDSRLRDERSALWVGSSNWPRPSRRTWSNACRASVRRSGASWRCWWRRCFRCAAPT